jgi:hypothetical protein
MEKPKGGQGVTRRKKNVKGSIYLLHFHKPLQHAKHYTGWAHRDVVARILEHSRGQGSKLMQAVVAAGIGFEVVSVSVGKTRNDERQLKQHGAARRCPICVAEKAKAAA